MRGKGFFQILTAALVLSLVGLLVNYLFTGSVSQHISSYGWILGSELLVSTVLWFFITHSVHKGITLTIFVFILFFGFSFNNLIEALIFNVTDRGLTIQLMVKEFFSTLLISPLLVYAVGKWNPAQEQRLVFEKRTIWSWIWRLIVGDVLYLIFYFVAGIVLVTVYPELLIFYEGKTPPVLLIIQTQLFLRGFIFLAIAYLISHTLKVKRQRIVLLGGCLFSILGGIAPLLQPNDLMPSDVRLGHGFEVGISNFLYGITATYLMARKQKS